MLPRNGGWQHLNLPEEYVSIADATLASPQRLLNFRDALHRNVSIADATLASPQLGVARLGSHAVIKVSIADATLASPQLAFVQLRNFIQRVSIADATLASPQPRAQESEDA